MKSLLSAIAFLTRLPVPARIHSDQQALRNSAAWFPFVGLLLGATYAGTAWSLRHALPTTCVAILLLIVDALLTGALHLDGLADMADGFGGGRTRDDVLRIMRDHSIGSYGAVALILALTLKFACVTELLKQQDLWYLFVAPTLGRWSIVLLSVVQPYARANTAGSGGLATYINKTHLLFASLTVLLATCILGWQRTLLSWLGVAVLTLLNSRYCQRRIGGITGDTLGANVIASECTVFLVALAAIRL